MNSAMSFSLAIVILSCAASVIAELKQSQIGVWIFKTLASVAFVMLALFGEAWSSVAGQWVVLGLGLSLAGDVLLIPKNSPLAFLFGFASFAAAHIAYCVAFYTMGLNADTAAWAAMPMLVFALVVGRWLNGYLTAPFNLVVPIYIAVIACMVILSAAAVGAGAGKILLSAAIIFALSDLFVARERFVKPAGVNTWLGLPLYYLAQCLFAIGVSVICSDIS